LAAERRDEVGRTLEDAATVRPVHGLVGASARPTARRERTAVPQCVKGASYFGNLTRLQVFTARSFCFTNCLFNKISSKEATGGAMSVDNGGAELWLDECRFVSCLTNQCGGGVHFQSAARADLTHCDFVTCCSAGATDDDGGGCLFFGQGDREGAVQAPNLVGVNLFRGVASHDGGGIVWRMQEPQQSASNFTECAAGLVNSQGGGGAFILLLGASPMKHLRHLQICACGRPVAVGEACGAVQQLLGGQELPDSFIHDSTWVNQTSDCCFVVEDGIMNLFGCVFVCCSRVFDVGEGSGSVRCTNCVFDYGTMPESVPERVILVSGNTQVLPAAAEGVTQAQAVLSTGCQVTQTAAPAAVSAPEPTRAAVPKQSAGKIEPLQTPAAEAASTGTAVATPVRAPSPTSVPTPSPTPVPTPTPTPVPTPTPTPVPTPTPTPVPTPTPTPVPTPTPTPVPTQSSTPVPTPTPTPVPTPSTTPDPNQS
jgi:hypothetical protein